MKATQFAALGCGVHAIIAEKEQNCGLKVQIQHFFEDLGQENDREC